MKKLLLIIILAVLAVSGCTPAVTGAPESYASTQPPAAPGTQAAASLPTLPPTQPPAAQPSRAPGCSVVSLMPTQTASTSSLFQPVGESDWMLGNPDAYVTILEYSDFQCPGCAFVAPVLARIAEKYPDQVRIVFRHFPLVAIHDKAALAAQAAEAAGKQDQFWKMHDLLYARRTEWVDMSTADFTAWLEKRAADLKLDEEQFKKDLTDPAIVKKVQEAWDENSKFMPGTPYIVINGEPYDGRLAFEDLDMMISLTLLTQKQYSQCPPMTIDPNKQYLAVLETEKGDITLELFADLAPLAVNNFVFLAREGWYDGVTFHRVLPDFVAQAGDPTGTGLGGPGYAFDNELNGLGFDGPGVVGMANAGPGSNGSQFFITYAAAPHLDGGYTIFGKVVSGLDVLSKLTPRNPQASMSLPPGDKILHISIIEK